MTMQRGLKAVGAAAVLALSLVAGPTWAADQKGHGHSGMGQEAMKAHQEKMGQLIKQLSEHTRMMKGIQNHERLGQEMIKHQEMIDQIMTEMAGHHQAMEGMMGGQHEGAEGEGHTHKGGKGSGMKPGGGMMQHGSGGMMEHR